MTAQQPRLIASVLTLLASSSTLFCCALPALIVALGSGAALASLMSAVPQLALISVYKNVLFTVSGCILLVSGVWRYRQRHTACPMDPALAKQCGATKRWSLRLYILSVMIYLTGFSFSFIIPRFMD